VAALNEARPSVGLTHEKDAARLRPYDDDSAIPSKGNKTPAWLADLHLHPQ